MFAQWNAEAIACMQQGRNKQAIRILSHALTRLEEEYPVTQPSHAETVVFFHAASNATTTTTTHSPQECTASIESERLSPIRSSSGREDVASPLYNCAFQLSSQGCIKVGALACVLLYNTALASHRASLQVCMSSNAAESVLSLYEESLARIEEYDLLELGTQDSSNSCGDACCSCTGEEMVLLCAALMHNMTIIHGERFERTQARFLRQQLALLLDWTTAAMSLNAADFNFFSVSLFCAMSEDFRLAPAA